MAKINMIKFACLISRITRMADDSLSQYAIEDLEALVEACIPEQPQIGISTEQLDALLAAMQSNRKIEAIKAYRSMTGIGLKESKDAIEKYWTRHEEATLGDILGNALRQQ